MVSGDLIVVYYKAGGAGKFLQNVLGLSKHCVLKHPDWAAWDCEQTQFDRSYYQQKFIWARSTIPANADDKWMGYELSDGHFFHGEEDPSPIAHRVAAAGRYATLSLHTYAERPMNYSRFHTVILDPAEQFATKWFRIKNPDAPDYCDTQRPVLPDNEIRFRFDMDNTISNTQRFVAQCQQLYEYFGWNDFKYKLVTLLHHAYMQWHLKYENSIIK